MAQKPSKKQDEMEEMVGDTTPSMSEKEKEALLKEAKKRFKSAVEMETEYRNQAKEDLKFYNSEQWSQEDIKERSDNGRPTVVANKIPAFVRQVTNELRRNEMAIQVDPTGNGAEKDTANVFSGLIKRIEQDSDADSAYDKSSWCAVTTGEGFLRIKSEEIYGSFDQNLAISAIANPMSVYFDPNSKESDGSDGEFCFVFDDIPEDEYKRMYPSSKMATSDTKEFGTDEWIEAGMVRLAEYFWKERESEILYMVKDPKEGVLIQKIKPTGKQVLMKKREQEKITVRWIKMNGIEILEENTWPGRWLPIVPVKGEEFWLNNKKQKSGIIKDLKDPQRAYNYFKSSAMEMVDLAPKAPFIIAKGQVEGFEHMWGDANTKSFGFLPYNPISQDGTQVGAPQRMSVEPPIQAIEQVAAGANDDMKGVSGIYDASLGANGNEQSGKAILARQQQAQTSNFHYLDNLRRSIKHVGRILVDVIPVFYDTERVIHIVKPDNSAELVAINGMVSKDGKTFDMTKGVYDVSLDTGASYATRRQEAVDSMLTIINAAPQLLGTIGDLVIRAMDFPQASEVADRVKATIPPAVLQATGEQNAGADDKQQVQTLTMQVQQFQEQIEKLTTLSQNQAQELKIAHDEVSITKLKADLSNTKATMDNDFKIRQLKFDEEKAHLEFMVKEQQLKLQEQALEIKKAQMAIQGVKVMSDVADVTHDRHIDHLDRIHGGDDDIDSNVDAIAFNPTDSDVDSGDIDTALE